MTLPNEDTASTYGAPFVDFAPVDDPTTDQSAAQANQLMASVAACTHTAMRAYVVFKGHATTPTIVEHNANWGSANAVIPSIAKAGGPGLFGITFPATVTAEDGTTIAVNLKRVVSITTEGPLRFFATGVMSTANGATISLYDTTNTASDFAGQNFVVCFR